MRRLILGTAGHIDHGKTALVKALTGVDTDRLKEEKERGITVDLGFAEFVPVEHVRFGVVDVPGHEGFIRNMLAGATGIDVALLVVAADEGVMPQTREHLAILTLLAVPRVVVVVSKTDLVEGEWLDLVMEEIRELLVETPYALAPLIPASVVTGRGLEELSGVLAPWALRWGYGAWKTWSAFPLIGCSLCGEPGRWSRAPSGPVRYGQGGGRDCCRVIRKPGFAPSRYTVRAWTRPGPGKGWQWGLPGPG
jgi:small GTP-binding protein